MVHVQSALSAHFCVQPSPDPISANDRITRPRAHLNATHPPRKPSRPRGCQISGPRVLIVVRVLQAYLNAPCTSYSPVAGPNFLPYVGSCVPYKSSRNPGLLPSPPVQRCRILLPELLRPALPASPEPQRCRPLPASSSPCSSCSAQRRPCSIPPQRVSPHPFPCSTALLLRSAAMHQACPADRRPCAPEALHHLHPDPPLSAASPYPPRRALLQASPAVRSPPAVPLPQTSPPRTETGASRPENRGVEQPP
jgi:hypothetical protein